MKFISTRGVKDLTFKECALRGYAIDGGLVLPERLPQINGETLKRWQDLSYLQLVIEVLSLFIDESEIPRSKLEEITNRAFSGQNPIVDLPKFANQNILGLQRLGDEPFSIVELFHGPTLAFKDLGLQMVVSIFEYLLCSDYELSKKQNSANRQNRDDQADQGGSSPNLGRFHKNIIVSTSGDTGSSAIYSVLNNSSSKLLDIFVLFPKDRVSHQQREQMIRFPETVANVHVYEVEGTSDDADVVMTALFADSEFVKENGLCTINSINIIRILVQMVHYFWAFLQVTKNSTVEKDQIAFSIPCGAFGNCFAGWLVRKMIGVEFSLICSTNENDILARFFKTGIFQVGEKVYATNSPSMDIQVPYNFERLLYYSVDEDPTRVTKYMTAFEKTHKIELQPAEFTKMKKSMFPFSTTTTQVEQEILSTYQKHKYVLDPHTAVGLLGARNFVENQEVEKRPHVLCLATAHPAKFVTTIQKVFPQNFPSQAQAPIFKKLADLPNLSRLLPKSDNWEAVLRKDISQVQDTF